MKGLVECIDGPPGLRNEMANSPDFWTILRRLRPAPDAAEGVFDILERLVNSTPSGITADNYEPLVVLLNDFATAGSVGAVQEQQRDQAARKGKQLKQKPQCAVFIPTLSNGGLRYNRTNEVVSRGSKAVVMVYHLTSRVSHFIEHSQLETTEGICALTFCLTKC